MVSQLTLNDTAGLNYTMSEEELLNVTTSGLNIPPADMVHLTAELVQSFGLQGTELSVANWDQDAPFDFGDCLIAFGRRPLELERNWRWNNFPCRRARSFVCELAP